MVNKDYVDSQIVLMDGTVEYIVNSTNSDSKLTAGSTEMTNNVTPLNMNGYKISSLSDAVSGMDALNRQTADARLYLNTTTLDSITAPNASVSLNSNKITNLLDPTLATDALNR